MQLRVKGKALADKDKSRPQNQYALSLGFDL
jgi:hypothetical protein